MPRTTRYDTPFDSWLRANEIKPVWLARKSGITRQTISRLRSGASRGTPRTRRDLVMACTALARKAVTAIELFGDDE
jgi:hypothetical protein